MNPVCDRRRTAGTRYLLWASTAGVAVVFASCMSLEQMAPPVGPEFTAVSQRRRITLAQLEHGRQVYLADCTRCHSVEPISRYSAIKWEDIVRRMARESNLNEPTTEALRAYVLAAHEVLSRRSESKVWAKARQEKAKEGK